MHVHFAPPDLGSLDRLGCEALALPMFSDERPLQGVLGLVDWRMCGLLSRLLGQGRIAGSADEQVLLPGRPKLAMEKLFVFGLGATDELDPERVRGCIERMFAAFARARVRSAALTLPGRQQGYIDPASAIESLLAVVGAIEAHDEVIVLDGPEAQREMEAVIERERRRARAHAG